MRRGDHLRLRLDRSVVATTRDRVHPSGRVRVDRFSRRSRGPPDLDRWRAGRVHGWGMGGLRDDGAAASGRERRTRRPPRHVDARGDHVDAEQRMVAFAVACAASDHALGRGAVDRAGQGRLRRHQHGDRPAVAGLRRDGGLPGVHRDRAVAIPDRAMGLPRLDPRADRPVDARAHRRRGRRTRSAVPVAAGSVGQRLDHPGHGSPAGARRLHRQPRGVQAASCPMAHVERRSGAGAHRSCDRGGRWRLRLGAKGFEAPQSGCRSAARRCAGGGLHGVLGRSRGVELARGIRRRRHQGRVDPAPGRHPLLRRDAHRRRRLVGVRLGVPRDEHQQAVGDPRPAVRGRASRWSGNWCGRPMSSSRTSPRG